MAEHASRTYSARPSELEPRWYLVDASGQTLGRLAANVARLLRGKHKAQYTPHLNSGDHVIVVNVKGLRVSGKKVTDKVYTSYTGYPGGLRSRAYGDMVKRHPTFPFRHAVEGMLQRSTLGHDQLKRLKVYSGEAHPHSAQRPVRIRFGRRGEVETIG
jgi:large subunit ribosomal protein L13